MVFCCRVFSLVWHSLCTIDRIPSNERSHSIFLSGRKEINPVSAPLSAFPRLVSCKCEESRSALFPSGSVFASTCVWEEKTPAF